MPNKQDEVLVLKPSFRIWFNGKEETSLLNAYITDIQYLDSFDDNVDSLSVTLAMPYPDSIILPDEEEEPALVSPSTGEIVEDEIEYDKIFFRGNIIEIELGDFINQKTLKTGKMEVDSIDGVIGDKNYITLNALSINSINNSFLRKINIDAESIRLKSFLKRLLSNSGYDLQIDEKIDNPICKGLSYKDQSRAEILSDLKDQYGLLVKITKEVQFSNEKAIIYITTKSNYINDLITSESYKPYIIDFESNTLSSFKYSFATKPKSKVIIRYYDVDYDELIEAESTSNTNKKIDNNAPYEVKTMRVTDTKAAKTVSQNLVNAQDDVIVSFTCYGDILLVAGTIIQLINFNSILNGHYLINSAEHTINESGWDVSVNMVLVF